MSESRFPSQHRLSSLSGFWRSCLTAQDSDGCRSCRSFARRAKDLSLIRNVRTGCGGHPALYSVHPEVRLAGTWWWLPASTAGVNTWPNLPVLPYAIMTRCSINTLTSSGYCTYHHFNIHKLYVLPTQFIYVLCMGLRTNSDYFPIQH
jgi:hypothetical protein